MGMRQPHYTTADRSLMCCPACLQVVGQLLGEEQLPWEGSNLTFDHRTRLGALRRPILQLLEREPAQRTSMQAFSDRCRSMVRRR